MKGLSLVELLVVIAIIAILLGIALGPGRDYMLRAKVTETANRFISDLEEVKRKSMIENRTYGISITSDGRAYVMFRDENGNCSLDTGEDIERIPLPNNLTISPMGRTLIWDRQGLPRSETCGFFAGTFKIGAGNIDKNVRISSLGRISLE